MSNDIKPGSDNSAALRQSLVAEEVTTKSIDSSQGNTSAGRPLPFSVLNNSVVRTSGSNTMRRNLYGQFPIDQPSSGTSVDVISQNAGVVPKIAIMNLVQQAADRDGNVDVNELMAQMALLTNLDNQSEFQRENLRPVRQRESSSESTQSSAGERYIRFTETSTVERDVSVFDIAKVETLALQDGTEKKKLGSGSFATTYLVQIKNGAQIDSSCPDNKFAFKELKDVNKQEKLLEELRSSFSVENVPRVMTTYGIYKIGGKLGILCEYIDGKNSGQFFSDARQALSDGAIDAKDFFNLIKHAFSDLMTALAGLEKRKLTHNDIAPDNLMFSFRTNQLIAVDFGLVKEYDQQTSIGKVPFMPPENVLPNHTANAKIDPFYAGQVLHAWIYGEPFNWANFKGGNAADRVNSAWREAGRFSSNQIKFDPKKINTVGKNDAGLFAGDKTVPPEITDLLAALLSGAAKDRLSAMAAISEPEEDATRQVSFQTRLALSQTRQAFFQRRKGPNTIKSIFENIKDSALQHSMDQSDSI